MAFKEQFSSRYTSSNRQARNLGEMSGHLLSALCWVMQSACLVSLIGFAFETTLGSVQASAWQGVGKSGSIENQGISLSNVTEYMRKVVFSPNGDLIAMANGGGMVVLYDIRAGKERLRLQKATDVCFANDGNTLVLIYPGQVSFCDLNTGKVLETKVSGAKLASIAPDYSRLAVTDGSSRVVVFRMEGTQRIQEFTYETYYFGWCEIHSFSPMALSPGGRFLALIQKDVEDGELVFWDVNAKTKLFTLSAKSGPIGEVAFTPNGKFLGTIAHRVSGPFSDHRPPPMGPGMRTILPEDSVNVWDAQTGKNILSIPYDADFYAWIGFSADSRLMAVSGKKIILWEMATGQKICECGENDKCFVGFDFAPDGRTIVGAKCNSAPRLWSLAPLNWQTHAGSLSTRELHNYWERLASEETPKAYDAVWSLSSKPVETLTYIEGRWMDLQLQGSKSAEELIAQLDDAVFPQREAATKALKERGPEATKLMREALETSKSPEVRARLLSILSAQVRPDGFLIPKPHILRGLRVVWVLERIGNERAIHLLQRIAHSNLNGRITTDAQESLDRLGARRKFAKATSQVQKQ
jgi:WD40 repeat protein